MTSANCVHVRRVGGGKSSLTEALSKEGWEVLDEAFLDMPHSPLHPQSLVMETSWMAFWFQRLLRMQRECPTKSVFFADRSPFSAVLYGSNGQLLDEVVRTSIEELKTVGIQVITVYLRTESDLLWERIQERLEREPERRKYKEDSRDWMNTTVRFYEARAWDLIVDNNSTIADLRTDLLARIPDVVPSFCPDEAFAVTPKGKASVPRILATSPARAE